MGEANCLIPEEEIESNNAGLSDVTALCGTHFDHVGTYKVSAWAGFRGLDGMEEYLDRKADSLCPECLEIAVEHFGWPATGEVLKVVA